MTSNTRTKALLLKNFKNMDFEQKVSTISNNTIFKKVNLLIKFYCEKLFKKKNQVYIVINIISVKIILILH